MSVCSVMRATSYLPWFIASMARSNSTLSGCFEFTLAIGLATLLWWQPATNNVRNTSAMRTGRRRNIKTSNKMRFAKYDLRSDRQLATSDFTNQTSYFLDFLQHGLL